MPLDENDNDEVDKVAGLYFHTVAVYKKIFKNIDTEWWPESGIEDKNSHKPWVCKHMFIYDSQIRAQALFPSLKECVA